MYQYYNVLIYQNVYMIQEKMDDKPRNMFHVSGIRQGRYTLQERTNAIIEMKKRQTERCSTESREDNSNHYLENAMQSSPFDHPSLSSSDMQSDSVSSFSCSQNSSLTSTSSISPPSSTSSPSSISSSLKPDPQILKNIKSEYSKIPSELGSSTIEIQQHISCYDSSSSTSTSEKHSQNSTVSQPLFPLKTENIAQDSEEQSSMLSTIEKLMDGYKELKPFTKNLSDKEIQALLSDGFVSTQSCISISVGKSFLNSRHLQYIYTFSHWRCHEFHSPCILYMENEIQL